MRQNKSTRHVPGGNRDETCDHGLSRRLLKRKTAYYTKQIFIALYSYVGVVVVVVVVVAAVAGRTLMHQRAKQRATTSPHI